MAKHKSFSAYMKWLENQAALFHKLRTIPPSRPLEIMKDSRYDLVPLHNRPDLLQQCCNLLNSEWKRSETARLKSMNISSDKFPTCLLLLSKEEFENEVLGYCKVSLVENSIDSVVIESFIIDPVYRYQGLGSMLLRAVEDYVLKKCIKNVYLMTKGQEEFYLKNGYIICEPIQELSGWSDYINGPQAINDNERQTETKNEATKKEDICAGPPPPPMPTDLRKPSLQLCLTISTRTFMKKKLEL